MFSGEGWGVGIL